MKILILIYSLLFTSISSDKLVDIITINSGEKIEKVYTIILDTSFIKSEIWSGLPEYQYKNSANHTIYLTENIHMSLSSLVNYENIVNEFQKNKEIKIKYFKSVIEKKRIVLEGIDSLNLYWKEVQNLNVFIGYSNIPKNLKIEFDSILNEIELSGRYTK